MDVYEPVVTWKDWYVRPQAGKHLTNGFTVNLSFVSSLETRNPTQGQDMTGSSQTVRIVCPRHPSGLPCYDDRIQHSLAGPRLDPLPF